jgi:hypothetical protein
MIAAAISSAKKVLCDLRRSDILASTAAFDTSASIFPSLTAGVENGMA